MTQDNVFRSLQLQDITQSVSMQESPILNLSIVIADLGS